MGKGKAWQEAEDLALAHAWLSVSSTTPAPPVADAFWVAVGPLFVARAPGPGADSYPPPVGTWNDRTPTALMRRWYGVWRDVVRIAALVTVERVRSADESVRNGGGVDSGGSGGGDGGQAAAASDVAAREAATARAHAAFMASAGSAFVHGPIWDVVRESPKFIDAVAKAVIAMGAAEQPQPEH